MKFFLVIAATLAVAAAGTIDVGLKMKVNSGIVSEAIIELPSIMAQIENSKSLQSLTGDAKVSALVSSLQGLTGAAQAPYVTKLEQLGLKYETFWASNIILVKNLNKAGLEALAEFSDDFAVIRPQFTASVDAVVHDRNTTVHQTVQWGVEKVGAPRAWAKHQGEGVVVGIIDTGVNGGHVALAPAYAGAWADPYYNNAQPSDTHGHGSHCIGSTLGRANGVGVAPMARWIACRGLNNQGSGTEAALTTCAQFMITANPKPHAVTNSWGGGAGQTWYNSQVSAWRQANIIPVFAIGNSGSGCRTANSPGDQGNLISVGATTTTDAMATFSSRGTATNGAMKPEVSAPGNQIVSCGTGTNNYATMSGTSMATPHVAGVIALYLSANPNASYDEVYRQLTTNVALPTLTNADRNCGLPTPGQDFPNNAFGHGRVDVAHLGN